MGKERKFCIGERWVGFKAGMNNLDPDMADALIERPELVILDVRTEQEQKQAGIPNSVGIDYFSEEFIDRLLGMDRERPYLVYCRTGRRSLRVCLWMQNSGFAEVYHLDGGFDAWSSQNREA